MKTVGQNGVILSFHPLSGFVNSLILYYSVGLWTFDFSVRVYRNRYFGSWSNLSIHILISGDYGQEAILNRGFHTAAGKVLRYDLLSGDGFQIHGIRIFCLHRPQHLDIEAIPGR